MCSKSPEARSKDINFPLKKKKARDSRDSHSRALVAFIRVLRLLLRAPVDADAAFLLVLLHQAGEEDLIHLVPLLAQQRIARCLEVLLHVLGRGKLLVEQLGDYAGAPCVDDLADLTRIEVKERRRYGRQLPHIRDLRIASDQITGFHGCAYFLSGLLEVIFGMYLVCKLIGFARQQLRELLVTVVVENVRFVFVKCWCVRS